jgi:hypothetical protein
MMLEQGHVPFGRSVIDYYRIERIVLATPQNTAREWEALLEHATLGGDPAVGHSSQPFP